MADENELPDFHNRFVAGSRLTRREMVQKLLAGMGTGAAWTQVAAALAVHQHLTHTSASPQAKSDAAWTPLFLDAHQNRTLILLAERIVPGSAKARVNRFIDLLLSVDNLETQQRFAESLSAFDRESVQRFGHPFQAITVARQNRLLTLFSEGHSLETPAQKRSAQSLHDHFENLKGWITGAYYSSEAGMRELGWTGDFVFDSFPGCQHPEGHR